MRGDAGRYAMLAVPATITLVDGAEEIVVRSASPHIGDPILCQEYDFGAPDVRDASTERVGADGVSDRAGYTGARTVTLDLVVLGDHTASAYAYVERLAALTHPYRRPRVQVVRNTPEAAGQTWEMTLRGSPFSITYGRKAAAMLELQLTFSAPDGYFLGPTQVYESAVTSDNTIGQGFVFPLSFPLSTGYNVNANPALTITVGGSAPISPVIYIYGPATNPEVRTDDGERFKLAGLSLATGQFVQIDMGAGTVLQGGAADSSMFHLIDFTVSTFWRWLPGEHTVRYIATSGRMAIHFRDRRYTV